MVAFTRNKNGLGKPVNMHVVPPSRYSIPVAVAGVHGHLFRILASRMSILFLISEAQFQKNIASLYRMERKRLLVALDGNAFGWVEWLSSVAEVYYCGTLSGIPQSAGVGPDGTAVVPTIPDRTATATAVA